MLSPLQINFYKSKDSALLIESISNHFISSFKSKKQNSYNAFLGCPSGFEPEIKAPQASVLPLHHGHHTILFI